LSLLALANFMRLSLMKAAHAVVSSAVWQKIRVRSGRDDNFVVDWTYSFPGRKGDLAAKEPSAGLGLQAKAPFPWKWGFRISL
jgi:hypothetical protein